jgi:hypothetical protein
LDFGASELQVSAFPFSSGGNEVDLQLDGAPRQLFGKGEAVALPTGLVGLELGRRKYAKPADLPGTIAILDVSGVHLGTDQQTASIGDNVALTALDLLGRVVAARPATPGRLDRFTGPTSIKHFELELRRGAVARPGDQ